MNLRIVTKKIGTKLFTEISVCNCFDILITKGTIQIRYLDGLDQAKSQDIILENESVSISIVDTRTLLEVK